MDIGEKGGDTFLKDVRVLVEDIGNRHVKVEFGFSIQEELQDEKEILKNIIKEDWKVRLKSLIRIWGD